MYTDSMDRSRRRISSCSRWSVPVLPRWRAKAAAQAEWMLLTHVSNSAWQGACNQEHYEKLLVFIDELFFFFSNHFDKSCQIPTRGIHSFDLSTSFRLLHLLLLNHATKIGPSSYSNTAHPLRPERQPQGTTIG